MTTSYEPEFETKTPDVDTAKVFKDIENGNLQGVMEYIDASGDPNARILKLTGNYPLVRHVFRFFDDEETREKIVQRLILELGLDVNTVVYTGKSLLDFAMEFEKDTLFQVLACNNVDVKGIRGSSALHYAILSEKPDRVEALISMGVDPKNPTPESKSMLAAAVRIGNEDVLRVLLQHKADPNFSDGVFDNPMFLALKDNRTRISEMLVKAGFDVNVEKMRRTALNIAAEFDRVSEMEMLLQAGARVNHVSEELKTALHWAVQKGNMGACLVLLTHGADINQPDGIGRTPLQIAVEMYYADVAKMLVSRGANPQHPAPGAWKNAWIYAERHSLTVWKAMKSGKEEFDRIRKSLTPGKKGTETEEFN